MVRLRYIYNSRNNESQRVRYIIRNAVKNSFSGVKFDQIKKGRN